MTPLEACTLAGIGVNVECECPKCGKETASAVRTEEGMVLWHCWRPSCGGSGVNWAGGPPPTGNGPRKPLPFAEPPKWVKRWGPPEPLVGVTGEIIGGQYRKHDENGKQVRTYRYDPGVPMYSFYEGENKERLWLVEDIASAKVLSSWGEPALALLGIFVSAELEQRVLASPRLRGRELVIALDPDVPDVALSLQRRLGGVVVFLEQDIKDMGEEELKKVLGAVRRG